MPDLAFQERLTCTLPQGREFTGLGDTTLRAAMRSARLVSVKVGRRRLIVVKSLIEFIGLRQPENCPSR
jgi:hypothetical protein